MAESVCTTPIVQSCDVYFYELALALGIDRMHEYLSGFGFGVRTGVRLHGESPGLMPSRTWKRDARGQPWYPGETLITGIGQGFVLATPLQLASRPRALRQAAFACAQESSTVRWILQVAPSRNLLRKRFRRSAWRIFQTGSKWSTR